MRKIRYRLYPPDDMGDDVVEHCAPTIGHYVMSERGRGAYLILGCKAAGKRGGLGEAVFWLFHLQVEKVSRAEAEARIDDGIVHGIVWDKRSRRAPVHLSDLAERQGVT